MKKVKCVYCEAEFNKEKEPYERVNKRYAHKECFIKHQQEIKDLTMLRDFIKQLYNPTPSEWGLIGSQLNKYKDEGMTYIGMYYTLVYYYKIEKNSKQSTNVGVGIIPYVYNRAKNYYKKETALHEKANDMINSNTLSMDKESVITIPQQKKKKQLIEINYYD